MLTVDVAGQTVTLYTTADLADMLGVSVRTAKDYVRRGRIRTVLLNRHHLIPDVELMRYLTARADDHPAGRRTEDIDLTNWENMETLF